MDQAFLAKIEVIELLQILHQHNLSMKVKLLSSAQGEILRHISNLPRFDIVSSSEEADLLIGHSAQLMMEKPKNHFLILSDEFNIPSLTEVDLYSFGYKSNTDRLFERINQDVPQSQRLRILVVTNLYPPQELGGYGRSIYDFAINLRQMGHEVSVLTSNAPYLGGDISNETSVNRNLLLLGSYEGGINILQNPQERKAICSANNYILHEAIRLFKPNVALLGNLDMLNPDLLHILVANNIPCWHHLGFSDPSMLPFPVSCLPTKEQGYQPLANSHFTARSMAPALQQYKPIPVIYPGAQTHFYTNITPLPLGGPLKIAFAGLLMGVKGPHILLEALAKLKMWNIPFHCKFAGGIIDNSFYQQLQNFSDAVGLSEHLDFCGKLTRNQLRKLFASNQIFVFPSTWEEPFGISQVEALAAGLLVVSSGTGGAAETVHDDINGRRFRPSDSQHLAEILLDIYQNPGAHEHLRKRGRSLAQTHFDTARETCKLSKLMIDRVH